MLHKREREKSTASRRGSDILDDNTRRGLTVNETSAKRYCQQRYGHGTWLNGTRTRISVGSRSQEALRVQMLIGGPKKKKVFILFIYLIYVDVNINVNN
jgi:hypothetical protein